MVNLLVTVRVQNRLIFQNLQEAYLFQAMASDLACNNVAKIPYFIDNLTHFFFYVQ